LQDIDGEMIEMEKKDVFAPLFNLGGIKLVED